MKIVVRPAKRSDLVPIRVWLEGEERREVPGNFLCNWSIIERSVGESLFVAIVNDEIVGFQVGGLLNPGILQVRNEWRRKGIGTAIVEYLFRRNVRRENWLLSIECTPHTSVPFWKAMGFTVDEMSSRVSGYKTLTRRYRLPKGTPVSARISFYPEKVKWEPDAAPLAVYGVVGSQVAGVVCLPGPVACSNSLCPEGGEIIVKIEVGGNLISAAMAKYDESKRAGVRKCIGGWWLRSINIC